MTEETHPLVALTDASLVVMLRRAIRNVLILGLIAALILWVASGWRNGAMMLTGALISAASILEWQRLIRLINSKLDKQKTPPQRPRRGRFLCAQAHRLRGGHLW